MSSNKMDHGSSSVPSLDEVELILGNSNANFSGVTSTMLQVLSHQRKLIHIRVMGKHFLSNPNMAISFWQTAIMCRKPLKNGKYRIFHARRVDEMIQAVVLKYVFRAKIKIVFSSAAQRFRSGLTLWLIRQMDAVVAISQTSSRYLVDKPDAIIPHGVQINDYAPAADKLKAWQDLGYGGKYGIAILGRVRKQKGVHLFVDACIELLGKYPDYTALVVGASSSNHVDFVDELKAKVERAGLSERIIFTGELHFERIPPIFSALSMVAALSDNEGFGLTVLEAMSCGAGVLATQAGAWQEIIREGIDGHVVPVEDLAAVTQKMDGLLADPQRLAAMGLAGRQRVLEHYTVEREAKALVDLFRSLQ
ncbi:MAG: mannosyltransferase [Paraglaciecola sp.]|jgi:mannosyltransferase